MTNQEDLTKRLHEFRDQLSVMVSLSEDAVAISRTYLKEANDKMIKIHQYIYQINYLQRKGF